MSTYVNLRVRVERYERFLRFAAMETCGLVMEPKDEGRWRCHESWPGKVELWCIACRARHELAATAAAEGRVVDAGRVAVLEGE